MKPNDVEIKVYSFKELCNLYQVSSNTLRRKLKREGLYHKAVKLKKQHYYFPNEVKEIFERLGTPRSVKK